MASLPFLSILPSSPTLLPPSALRLRPRPLVAGGRRPRQASRRKSLRRITLTLAAFHEEEALPGLEHRSHGGKRAREQKWSVDRLLAFGEGMCVAASTAACTACLISERSGAIHLVASSTPTTPANSRFHMSSTWQVIPLLVALIINIILRTRQWQGMSTFSGRSEGFATATSTLNQRIKKLEEDVGSTVTIVRVLSRQLEKLGVRFRVTRQTLRDPIQETAMLAQKTSETVSGLAACEEFLEMEIKEIQQVLLAMQESQVKQLELISVIAKAFKQSPNENIGILSNKQSMKGLHLEQKGFLDQDVRLNTQDDINCRTHTAVTTEFGHVEAQNSEGGNTMKDGLISRAKGLLKRGPTETRSVADVKSHDLAEHKADNRSQDTTNKIHIPTNSNPDVTSGNHTVSESSFTGRETQRINSGIENFHTTESEGSEQADEASF